LEEMRAAGLRDHCLAFPGSAETFPFGAETSVFKVAGKMFALSRLAQSSLQVSVKCEPLLAEQLRNAHRAVLPGYHLNKRHWNTLLIDGSLPDRTIRDMVEDSYDLVVSGLPRSQRHALGWRADERQDSKDLVPGRAAVAKSSTSSTSKSSGRGVGS
jgi:predicted DNA-binding protein (MmcQ/YjbR family)